MEDEQLEEVIEEVEEVETDELQPEEEPEESDDSEDEAEEPEEDSEDDGFFIDVGEDEPEEREVNNSSFRQLRQASRDKDKRIRELEKAIQEREKPEEVVDIGPKPTLEDYDYDADKFSDALLDWNAKKQEQEQQLKAKQEAEQAKLQAWEQRIEAFNDRKAKVKNTDFEVMEQFVTETLTPNQNALIIAASDDAVRDMYLLGKSPEDLERLSKITNDAEFVYQLAKLQTGGKTMAKSKAPKPEKRVKPTAARGGGSDAKLKQLREEAAVTGDFSKVSAYKRSLRK